MDVQEITSNDVLEQAFHIRKEVFVKEQGVPLEDEFDAYDVLDGNAAHIIVYEQDVAVGTGRIRYVDGYGKLERICILKDYRKLGIGKAIIAKLEEIAKVHGETKVKLHGQTHAEGFYHKLGYQTASDVFMEDGIAHLLMTKNIEG